MQGTILKYDDNTHAGFISGHDGKRYQFSKMNWNDNVKIKENMVN